MVATPAFIVIKLVFSVITIVAASAQMICSKTANRLIALIMTAIGFSASGALYISVGGANYVLFGITLLVISAMNLALTVLKIRTLAEERECLQAILDKHCRD